MFSQKPAFSVLCHWARGKKFHTLSSVPLNPELGNQPLIPSDSQTECEEIEKQNAPSTHEYPSPSIANTHTGKKKTKKKKIVPR